MKIKKFFFFLICVGKKKETPITIRVKLLTSVSASVKVMASTWSPAAAVLRTVFVNGFEVKTGAFLFLLTGTVTVAFVAEDFDGFPLSVHVISNCENR